jgi:hypothetical protein
MGDRRQVGGAMHASDRQPPHAHWTAFACWREVAFQLCEALEGQRDTRRDCRCLVRLRPIKDGLGEAVNHRSTLRSTRGSASKVQQSFLRKPRQESNKYNRPLPLALRYHAWNASQSCPGQRNRWLRSVSNRHTRHQRDTVGDLFADRV